MAETQIPRSTLEFGSVIAFSVPVVGAGLLQLIPIAIVAVALVGIVATKDKHVVALIIALGAIYLLFRLFTRFIEGKHSE